MDYVAKAQEASRRWREAQGLPLRAALLTYQSFSSSVPRKEGILQEEEKLARECSTTETIETTEERVERVESNRIQRDRELGASTTKAEQATTKGRESLCPSVPLNPKAVKEALGAQPAPHALACLRFDVLAAIRQLEAEIMAGILEPRPLLVRGLPLADWLSLDDVARLLKAGKR